MSPDGGDRDGPGQALLGHDRVDLGRWLGVPSWKWTSQTVPPVKSIENFRPSLPPVNGVSRMKISPGIVISRLKR